MYLTCFKQLYSTKFLQLPMQLSIRCEFESRSGEVYSIHHYVKKFVSDL